eukprot:1338028-Amphidinium_carterae.1
MSKPGSGRGQRETLRLRDLDSERGAWEGTLQGTSGSSGRVGGVVCEYARVGRSFFSARESAM